MDGSSMTIIFGLDISGNEILFCYGWLDGEDSDNVLPATTFEEDADTVHIHDLAVFITNQEAAAVSVQVGVGSFVTTAQMTAYAAPVLHTQAATTKRPAKPRNRFSDARTTIFSRSLNS